MGRPQPFCLNYDIMAHETGHSILFSQIGVPAPDQISVPFLAFHGSFADLVALIGVLHFGSVQTRLLEQTGGNLYVLNLVNRSARSPIPSRYDWPTILPLWTTSLALRSPPMAPGSIRPAGGETNMPLPSH